MSSGPGRRQRALLGALARPGVGAVWAVPQGVSASEATAWRRAAKGLAIAGRAKAVYLRRRDRSGRAVAHLALAPVGSAVFSDVLPNRAPSPWWVEGWTPGLMLSLSAVMQAELLEHATGLSCSPSTAGRMAREARGDAPGEGIAFVTPTGPDAAA